MAQTSKTAVYTVLDGHRKVEAGGTATLSVKIVVNGRAYDLASVGQMKPGVLAVLNSDLRKAGVPAPVANVIFPAKPSYVSTARHLSDQERAQYDAGEKTLAFFHTTKAALIKADRAIEAVVRKDPARAQAVFDRIIDDLTAPTPVPAKK